MYQCDVAGEEDGEQNLSAKIQSGISKGGIPSAKRSMDLGLQRYQEKSSVLLAKRKE